LILSNGGAWKGRVLALKNGFGEAVFFFAAAFVAAYAVRETIRHSTSRVA